MMTIEESLTVAFYATVVGYFLGLAARCFEKKKDASFLSVFLRSNYLIFDSMFFFASLIFAPISRTIRERLFRITVDFFEMIDRLHTSDDDKRYLVDSLVQNTSRFVVFKLAMQFITSYLVSWNLFAISLIKLAAKECAENDNSKAYVEVFEFNTGNLTEMFQERITRSSLSL